MEQELLKKIEQLENELRLYKAAATLPYDFEQAVRERFRLSSFLTEANLPDGLTDAPLTAITAPAGGATQDAEARSAINSIITTLENLGLVNPN